MIHDVKVGNPTFKGSARASVDSTVSTVIKVLFSLHFIRHTHLHHWYLLSLHQ